MNDLFRLPSLRLRGIDLARGTRILSAYRALESSQWFPRDQLEGFQTEKFIRLVSFVGDAVPFYRDWFEKQKLSASDFTSLDDIVLLPVVTKAQIKANPTFFMPEGGFSSRQFLRKTGGSTGEPFEFLLCGEALSQQWGALFRIWEGTGYRLGDAMATVGGGSVASGSMTSFRQLGYDFLRRNRSWRAENLDNDSLGRIEKGLRAQRPRLVYGYPSLLYQLANHILGAGAVLDGVASVITTSEMLFPGQRKVIEKAFGCPVFDQYGCNEVNLVSGECSFHDGFHIASEQCFVEVLEENEDPRPEGEVGRIVGTNLENYSMAFIRYETGDLGALHRDSCPCGRGLDRIKNLGGRSRDLVKGANGRFIHGVAFNKVVLKYPWVDRYQIVQDSAQRISMNLAFGSTLRDTDLQKLRAEVSALCGLEVELLCNQPFELTKGQKARVIISRLEGVHGT